ncbi:MAG TPA: ATP-binding protein [Lentimicrobium sp.]|nr:ATP-binding protein [Lentimicrobium sp.]
MSKLLILAAVEWFNPAVLSVLTLAFAIVFVYSVRLLRNNLKLNKEIAKAGEQINSLKQELIEVKKKAEESDKLKSSFLANMSHELRTPLNAIMGFSSLLQQSPLDESENQQYIEIIHRNSNKLLDMMDEIFNIALIESGSSKMYKEECQINEMISSLVAFFNMEKEMMDKQHIALRIKKLAKDTSFAIYTDPRKLRQTLYNLVENALKYTNEGYIEVGYDLKENSMIEFYVKDTGLGFPQEKLDVIFKSFRQVDDSNTRSFGGIGLGLTLSQKFVEMMGGNMWAVSVPGNGSTFYFTLPYLQKNVTANEQIQTA